MSGLFLQPNHQQTSREHAKHEVVESEADFATSISIFKELMG